MKNYLIITGVLLSVLSCDLSQAAITVLSETHHVWGSNNGDIQSGSYDVRYPETTTEIPISGDCYGQWSSGEWWAGHSSYAMSSAGNFAIHAESTAPSASWPQEWYSNANASSTYTFAVQGTSLDVQYRWSGSYWWEWSGQFLLSDITEGTEMENIRINSRDMEDYHLIAMNYAVDPGHLYMLQLQVEAHSDSTTDGRDSGNLHVAIVPEPATLLLLGLGAFFLKRRNGKTK